MICAHHLALQAEDSEVNLLVVPPAVTVFRGDAFCLACFWTALDDALPKADDQ